MTHSITAAMKWKRRIHLFLTKMKVSRKISKVKWNQSINENCFDYFAKDICTKFENLCTQICEPTDDSYVCKCNDGFKLAVDRKTCVKEDEDASTDKSNEVPVNATEYDSTAYNINKFPQRKVWKFSFGTNWFFRDCPTGYTKNELSGQCDDIDECEGTDVNCNLDTQVCHNVPGSYKCLDVLQVSSCPNGFKMDPKIKQCIGNWRNS